jgi:hypothetical protein
LLGALDEKRDLSIPDLDQHVLIVAQEGLIPRGPFIRVNGEVELSGINLHFANHHSVQSHDPPGPIEQFVARRIAHDAWKLTSWLVSLPTLMLRSIGPMQPEIATLMATTLNQVPAQACECRASIRSPSAASRVPYKERDPRGFNPDEKTLVMAKVRLVPCGAVLARYCEIEFARVDSDFANLGGMHRHHPPGTIEDFFAASAAHDDLKAGLLRSIVPDADGQIHRAETARKRHAQHGRDEPWSGARRPPSGRWTREVGHEAS